MTYRTGVHDLGDGAYAYLQDCNRGSAWGWSNTGLLADSGEALLIDTLRDENFTRTMVDALCAAAGLRHEDIRTLVNTHRDADHTFGNGLFRGTRIVASEACVPGMRELHPSMFVRLLGNLPPGDLGAFLYWLWGPPFDFNGLDPALPNDTFKGRRSLRVGRKDVELIEVGPAHTDGDIMVHVPANRLVYSGDMVFLTNTPIIWNGPHENWIAALDMILEMDVITVVPGHGPVTDKAGVRKVKQYFELIEQESRKRHDKGMGAAEAAADIALGEFADWGGTERTLINVMYFYRRFGGDASAISVSDGMALMAPIAMRRVAAMAKEG